MIFKIGLRSLPFELTKEQVYYVENEYNEKVNRYIQFNYDEICKAFSNKGLQFYYLPKLKEELAKATDVIDYYAPYEKAVCSIKIDSSFMLDYMLRPENKVRIGPALLFLDDSCCLKNDTVNFKGVFLDGTSIETERIFYAIEKIWEEQNNLIPDVGFCCECEESGIRFRITGGELVPTEDDFDDIETKELIRNLKATADRLEKKGIERYLLELMVRGEKKQSPLHVTKDYRLFLPDYNNMEIKMGTREKALYLLYLNHPEGISFKCLPNHHDELLAIYLKLKKGNDTEKVRNTVRSMVEYDNNIINTLCSHIRLAFCSKCDKRVAQDYCIEGKQGEKKTIDLPPEMVVWL